ncbi:glycoside hydrolase family 88 protein [Sinomicrobium weinanense]|uniref:Glycoside hydrolase family 88 protein n=1 Tax=Sinomicrobium weinanense TaxID=2842200 RepID=A0A926JNZ5_9FLAO|nr:glycoside hydrolase family 88 protein [Sinomicrobium weinanense]MBC9794654.1 glycoside hydrolase family 88 protein [Sinomicrobium weinanense]MBU3124139.1 glycoside hydrolase family 88 protein [Sinomicrobium weinanense]
MKYKLALLLFTALAWTGCSEKPSQKKAPSILELSQVHYDSLYKTITPLKNSEKMMPRTTRNGKLVTVGIYDWTSGFFPASLWNLYGLTKDKKWKDRAVEYTEKLDSIQYWEGNHDVGFIMECTYGNALKYMDSPAYDSVVVQTARSLSARFRPNAGVIQSWEWSKKWDCPVIIDNMMNLELLFHATRITGDSTYYNIAVSHADKTIENHYREDNSSFHVVDYDTETGEIIKKNTHQGLSDDSAWARGQAWGLYGFTMSYRETGDPKYLEQAQKIADFIQNHPNLPEDKVPYWDYNAPASKDTPRDASAAAIAASALYELSTFADNKNAQTHQDFANLIMESLRSPAYFAKVGTNADFLLMHSVGSKPHDVEVDVPLNYADYYFLEALLRKKDIDGENKS